MVVAVRVEHLQKSYGSVHACRDVTFTIAPGEIFGLLGPNGAGKTTTLRCLSTLTQADAGVLEIAGTDVTQFPKVVRQKLGYVAQEVALDKVLTGRELLQLQAAIYHLPSTQIAPRIQKIVDVLGLGEWIDRKCGTYSGGIRKRLDLAAGLLHQPQVLILDEPTVGLDIESRVVIWDFLRQLRQEGITVLLTSHYLEEVDLLADRVAIIDQGEVIASDTPQALKAQVGGERITLRIREFTADEEAHQAKELIQGLDFVQTVIINAAQGNSLNLVIQPNPQALSTIQTMLSQANLPIFGIAQAQPSLDDVYLAATGKTLMDAELAAVGTRDEKKERKQNMR